MARLARVVAPGGPLVAQVSDWRRFLAAAEEKEDVERLRRHLRTGRPLGDAAFLARLEALSGRWLAPRQGGRPRKTPRP